MVSQIQHFHFPQQCYEPSPQKLCEEELSFFLLNKNSRKYIGHPWDLYDYLKDLKTPQDQHSFLQKIISTAMEENLFSEESVTLFFSNLRIQESIVKNVFNYFFDFIEAQIPQYHLIPTPSGEEIKFTTSILLEYIEKNEGFKKKIEQIKKTGYGDSLEENLQRPNSHEPGYLELFIKIVLDANGKIDERAIDTFFSPFWSPFEIINGCLDSLFPKTVGQEDEE